MKLLADGWNGWWGWVGRGAGRVSYYLLTYPLEQLYLRGFWRGRAMPEICSALAPVSGDAAFWHSQPDACASLVYSHFDSYAVWVYMGIYLMVIALTLRLIFRKMLAALCRQSGQSDRQSVCSSPPTPDPSGPHGPHGAHGATTTAPSGQEGKNALD